jgi:NAD(P)-dependent dehydrogenase (short-subunit alcohol dehydrogenase family)
MKPALILLGATGGLGRGVVRAAVEAGRPLVAVARDGGALVRLRDEHPQADISVIDAGIASDGDAARLAARLRELDRPFAGVVAAICGGIERGRLLDQPADFLRRKLDEDLLPHLFAARHLLPLLGDGMDGSKAGYVVIGGPGGEQPWAGYGHRSVGAAALRMLVRVLHDEADALPVRVQLLAVDTPVRTDANRAHACSQWPHAVAVGRCALDMVEQASLPRRAPSVVHFPAAAAALPSWSDDIDDIAPATPPMRTPQTPPPRAQETDIDPRTDPQRCLFDARQLLHSLASHLGKNQEPSR